MKQLACLLLIFFSSCGRAPDPCTYFQGTAMEKQYNIAIGKKLTRKEKRCVNDAIEAAFAEADRLLPVKPFPSPMRCRRSFGSATGSSS
jgi:thiamine biosynthesis lipoprotein ApbE